MEKCPAKFQASRMLRETTLGLVGVEGPIPQDFPEKRESKGPRVPKINFAVRVYGTITTKKNNRFRTCTRTLSCLQDMGGSIISCMAHLKI